MIWEIGCFWEYWMTRILFQSKHTMKRIGMLLTKKLEYDFYRFSLLWINHIHSPWRPCLLIYWTRLSAVCHVLFGAYVAVYVAIKKAYDAFIKIYKWLAVYNCVYAINLSPIKQSIYTCSSFHFFFFSFSFRSLCCSFPLICIKFKWTLIRHMMAHILFTAFYEWYTSQLHVSWIRAINLTNYNWDLKFLGESKQLQRRNDLNYPNARHFWCAVKLCFALRHTYSKIFTVWMWIYFKLRMQLIETVIKKSNNLKKYISLHV